jgi:hypothetical protein
MIKYVRLFLVVGTILVIMNLMVVGGPGQKVTHSYEKKVYRFEPVLKIDEKALPDGQYMGEPFGVTEDDDGFIYVSDQVTHTVKKFDSRGKFVQSIGQRGAGPGDFNAPTCIAVSGSNLIVLNYLNFRIDALTCQGKFIQSLKFNQQERPVKIRALGGSDVVIEFEKVFTDSNKPQECVLKLFSNKLEFKKELYRHAVKKSKFISEPHFGEIEQPFPAMVLWDVSGNGNVALGFSGKYEIEIHDKDKGMVSRFSHSYKPVQVTEDHKKAFFSQHQESYFIDGKRVTVLPDFIKDNTIFPEFKPAFASIIVDSEGNILVRNYKEDDSETGSSYFDVFGPTGKFIRKVKVLGDVNLITLKAGRDQNFWDIKMDKESNFIITKYQLSH